MPVALRIQSPWTPDATNPLGAIGILQLTADAEEALHRLFADLALPLPEVGGCTLATLLDIDRGLIARPAPTVVLITPHGSPLVIRRLADAIADAGAEAGVADADPRAVYPEAGSLAAAAALSALATASSPLALDFVLEHRERWLGDPGGAGDADLVSLNHLLAPPTVALVGPPNIGKSTLTNALARRDIAIVHDAPGVTRDHVGVTLTLAGLTVHWLDTPGLRAPADDIERAAIALAGGAIRGADLVVLAGDATAAFPETADLGLSPGTPVLRVGLRSDLGEAPGADISTAAITRHGLDDLAAAVLEALIPGVVRRSGGLWAYHRSLGARGA